MPAGNYAEKISLMIMSGDVPDLIYFQGGDDKIAMQDLLVDLRPYVDKSKSLKTVLDQHSKLRLESYPYLVWVAPPRVRAPVIRQDWFDSLPSAKAGARKRLIPIRGTVPSPFDAVEGCVFRERCPVALPECAAAMPELKETAPGHHVACVRST